MQVVKGKGTGKENGTPPQSNRPSSSGDSALDQNASNPFSKLTKKAVTMLAKSEVKMAPYSLAAHCSNHNPCSEPLLSLTPFRLARKVLQTLRISFRNRIGTVTRV